MNSCCCENPYVGKGQAPFNPSEVRLYGRKQYCPKEVLEKDGGKVKLEGDKIKLKAGSCYIVIDPGEVTIVSIGVIYGYAYEGHCYKLPKPKIMYLPVDAQDIISDNCGCDCGYSTALGYSVWQTDKLARVIALDVRSDDLKTLVLDENMPGNRSPLAYSQTLALAPQRSHE